jgi:transcriptional regulator with XRE-family HTH domain
MRAKERVYSEYTKDAAVLLGKHIQLARKARKLTEKELSERIGISRTTLQKLERGDLKCEIGIVFEAAAIVGINLFDVESRASFAGKLERVNDKLALLPKSVRKTAGEVDDAF